jgi:3-dehydroquinate dehydratase
MKDCVVVKIAGMGENEYLKLVKALRKTFPDTSVEIFTFRKEWEM